MPTPETGRWRLLGWMDRPAALHAPETPPALHLTVELERAPSLAYDEPPPRRVAVDPDHPAYAAFRRVYAYPREAEWRTEPLPVPLPAPDAP